MAGKKEQRRLRKEKRRLGEQAPEKVRLSVRMSDGKDMTPENSVQVPADEWFDMFKTDALDKEGFGGVMDGIMRNTIRMTCQAWTKDFAAIPIFRPKKSLWLQILLVDENRVIQGKFHGLGAEVALAKSNTYVVERSRKLFKETVPLLLQNGALDRWIFSRSLFMPDCNGSMEDALDFPMYDPLDSLLELPKNLPSEIRCTEAFLFLAGDFPNKDGFSCREAILELLHELASPINNNLHGFWVCAASAKLSKEKVEELKGIHIPVKRG